MSTAPVNNHNQIFHYQLSIFIVFAVFIVLANSARAGLILGAPKYAGLSSGLVGFWSFDGPDMEFKANRAYDRSGLGNDGTLFNMSTSSSPVAGKIGQALDFDGVNDYINLGNFAVVSTGFTMSAWIKIPAADVNDGRIIQKAFSTDAEGHDWMLSLINSGGTKLRLRMNQTIGTALIGLTTLATNRWYHAVATFNNGVGTIYLDGVEDNSGNIFNSNPLDNNTNPVYIGQNTAFNGAFNGRIDDVRIYNRALLADEVKRLYRIGATLKLGVSKANDTLAKGLVGWWTFDDNNMNATQALDTSGQGNHGALTNMDTKKALAKGKLGQALSFDGVNDQVDAGSGSSLTNVAIKTISAWIKPRTIGEGGPGTHGAILGKSNEVGAGWALYTCSNQVSVCPDITNTVVYYHGAIDNGSWAMPANILKLNEWQHIVMIYNQSSAANNPVFYFNGSAVAVTETLPPTFPDNDDGFYNFRIGDDDDANANFDGLIDDVRIYNRVLTGDEIKRLYKIGATLKLGVSKANDTLAKGLVGWWTFDDNNMNATQALDTSGQGNNGTLTNMDTKKALAKGKLGQALSFDGSNDFVKISDPPPLPDIYDVDLDAGKYTWSAWVKPNDFDAFNTIFAQNNGGNGMAFYAHTTGVADEGPVTAGLSLGVGIADFDLDVHSTNNVLSLNEWYHVVGTFDSSLSGGNRLTVYVNGKDVTDRTDMFNENPTGTVNVTQNVKIGSDGSGFMGGSIDDVRIYNRALSPAEIQRLYNLGR